MKSGGLPIKCLMEQRHSLNRPQSTGEYATLVMAVVTINESDTLLSDQDSHKAHPRVDYREFTQWGLILRCNLNIRKGNSLLFVIFLRILSSVIPLPRALLLGAGAWRVFGVCPAAWEPRSLVAPCGAEHREYRADTTAHPLGNLAL